MQTGGRGGDTCGGIGRAYQLPRRHLQRATNENERESLANRDTPVRASQRGSAAKAAQFKLNC